MSRISRTALLLALVASPALAKTKDAKTFVTESDKKLKRLMVRSGHADWLAATYINEDSETISADMKAELSAFTTQLMMEARAFDKAKVDPETRRFLTLFKNSSDPGPKGHIEELTSISTKMEGLYGKYKICDEWAKKSKYDEDKDGCLSLDELDVLMAEDKLEGDLLNAWNGWHQLGGEIKPLYKQFVSLANKGAREAGFHDMGEVWRSRYDMPVKDFGKEMERLWTQVQPLYQDLHCYVKSELETIYPQSKRSDGKINAHLLGNMWAQEWNNLYPALEPYPGESALDVNKALKDKEYDATKMAKLAESFFTSMGFDELPKTFWERSMLTKPRDRDVVCHASAWDVSYDNDLRVKMCIQVNEENLITLHHELGHIFYYQSYYKLPVTFQQGANDGFHEAIGDAIALSVNPTYLAQVGLIPSSAKNSDKAQINLLLKNALSKVAFLPFGFLVDKWRWEAFDGKATPENYNKVWWELRGKYQGVGAPNERGEDLFDPGAKYHVASNTPYARYFLATILQFQMFKSMCDASGYKGALPNCSLYGSKVAGARLKKLLAVGASKPWQESFQEFAGTDHMDAKAMIEYFAPLQKWLKEKNQGKSCDWN